MLKQGGIAAAVSLLGKALVIPALLAGFAYVTPASAQPAPPPNPPGLTRGTGTHFSLPNSPYLPVTLDSDVVVTLTLTSVPEIVDLLIFDGAADAAAFTIGGFAPNTTYYRYTDNGLDPIEITTDSEGTYSFSQDLLKRHHVWFQERRSTFNLYDSDTDGPCNVECTDPALCPEIGTWVAATKTCTLTDNVSQSIFIQGSGITLDGAGHIITPTPEVWPVYSWGYNNVTIKGLRISNPYPGLGQPTAAIYVSGAGITVTKNTISKGYFGIMAYPPYAGFKLLTVTENNISDTSYYGIYSYYGDANIDLNTISHSGTGIFIYDDWPGRTFITNNSISGCGTGIEATSAETIEVRNNTISNSSVGLNLGLVLKGYENERVEVYNNSFIGNATSISYVGYLTLENPSLAFDLPVPVGGNHWSDLHISSSSCLDTNDDGFCDAHTNAQFCSGIDSNGFCADPYYIFTPSGYLADLKDNRPWMTADGWSSIPTNQRPTASAGGPYSVNEGTALVLSSAVATDPELDPLSYSWFVDPGPCSFEDPGTLNPTLICTDNGRFTVALVVSDDINAAVMSTATVTVHNVAPVASFFSSAKVNTLRYFSLSLTSPNDPSLDDTSTGFQYAFDCGTGTGYGPFSGSPSVVCDPVSIIGNRTVKGKIRDKDLGETEYDNSVAIIANERPTVELPFASAEPSVIGQGVYIHAAFSDPGSTNGSFTCVVNYGDGSSDDGRIDGFYCRTSPHAYLSDGTKIVTVHVTDDDGSTGSNSFQHEVTKADATPPVIGPHDPVTAEATNAAGAIVIYDLPTANDAYDGQVEPTCTPAPGSIFALGTKTVICTAKDAANNEATPTTFDVTVVDKARPVIGLHDAVTAEATSAAGATVNYILPATTDNVDTPGTATCLPVSGSTFELKSTTVTCNATDAAGNHATPTTFFVTVVDTKPPVIAAHANVTVTSSTAVIVSYDSPATSDIVDGTGTASCSPQSGSTFAVGSTIVTCYATDAAGNPAIPTTFIVTVNDVVLDTTPPVVTPPANVTVEATGPQTTVSYGSATATDNVGVESLTHNAPATFLVGVTTITWSATDAAGNTGTATSTVTVRDTTAPVVTAPANVTVEATGPQTTVSYGSATATDLVSGAVTPTKNAPATFPVGVTTITWSATDAAGNTGTATSTVAVQDTTPPVVTAPAILTVEAIGSLTPVTCTASAADAVGVTSLTNDAPTSFPVGVHTVKWTAKDAKENAGTAETIVTVKPWKLEGFYRPVDMNDGTSHVWNMVKGGSTVPLKFEVFAGNTERTDVASTVQSLTIAEVVCSEGAEIIIEDSELPTTGGTSLRYDTAEGQFINNWKTPKNPNRCYRVTMATKDGNGNSLKAYFKLK